MMRSHACQEELDSGRLSRPLQFTPSAKSRPRELTHPRYPLAISQRVRMKTPPRLRTIERFQVTAIVFLEMSRLSKIAMRITMTRAKVVGLSANFPRT